MKHLIRKQVISLQLDAGQDAFAIQRQTGEYYHGQIVPALEKLFDELSSDQEVISIDRFEIDLGDLGWNHDCFALDADDIYHIAKKVIRKTLSESGNKRSPAARVTYRTREENTCMHWLHYMEKGVLPWELRAIDDQWYELVLHQLAIDHHLIRKTTTLLTSNPRFLTRVVREHTVVFLHRLIEIISARQQPDLIPMLSGKTEQSRVWENVLRQFASGKTEVDMTVLPLTEDSTLPLPPLPASDGISQEGIFCQYAGLVLLHGFFKYFFNNLALLVNGNFRDHICREKAVVLLYFVATGKTTAHDHELVVPKALCGMELAEIISEESFLLTDAEKEESLTMMHAAIEQWPVLRNTSPEALREGFLDRDGKLLFGEAGMEFRVETNSIDILLDTLPWNLSMIKFPWLEQLIRVNWR